MELLLFRLNGRGGSYPMSGTTMVSAEAEVIGPVTQPVETPAGKFKVFEIRRTDYSGSVGELIYFYSPRTKSVVKLTIDRATERRWERGYRYKMELIEFGRGAPVVKAPVVKAPTSK